MSSFKNYDEIINFPNNASIEINYAHTKTYTKCSSYDVKVMTQGYIWHQIVVKHNGKIYGQDSKRRILNSLYDIVDGEEIYPVAYRYGQREDRFLVRQCQSALDKLFAQKLRINLPNGLVIPLKVQLNVAKYIHGQISPTNQINRALNELFNKMEYFKGENGILNVTQFSRNRHLSEIIVNLGNCSVLDHFCQLIHRNDMFLQLNGIIMKKNGITTLTPLTIFKGIKFAVLDFRDNKLESLVKLCDDLKLLKADYLMLAGNPVTDAPTYPQCLMSVSNNFKFIDGIPSENLSGNCTPLNKLIKLENEGYRIDISNKSDINRFENSSDWHAFVIPDSQNTLSKEELFDYFFSMVSPTHSDMYPCYYKHISLLGAKCNSLNECNRFMITILQYDDNDHRFVVRKCFDQIVHLIDTTNLKIKKPCSSANDAATISYYLLMNTCSFQKGQVEPLECIDTALARCFNAMDRMLNLNNFQNVEGLENIIINLTSSNILSRLLMQASRKFLSACVELRLAHNKIINVNCSNALKLMNNLKAIDLSNNWLNDLNNIKGLAVLNIRSLCLDGNPLCAQYNFKSHYIKAVKSVFSNLAKLDNIQINMKGFNFYKNYLCDMDGYDFVEQFLTYYFKTFESITERMQLRNIYHPQATFSMTCNYNLSNATPQTIKRISCYGNVSRNLLKESNKIHCHVPIHFGCHDIMNIFMQFPNIRFDLLSFTTTTTKYDKQMIVITVTGTFLDQAQTIIESDILMGFSRTFILSAVKENLGLMKGGTVFQIFNDQFNVFNPTLLQSKNAFKYYKNDEKKVQDKEPLADEDKEPMLSMMQELTQMKSIWCARCLVDANWDFEAALKVFLDLYNKNEIPESAFH